MLEPEVMVIQLHMSAIYIMVQGCYKRIQRTLKLSIKVKKSIQKRKKGIRSYTTFELDGL